MAPKCSQPLLQIHKKDFWDLECILGYLDRKIGKNNFYIFFDIPQWQMRNRYEFLKSCFLHLQ